jgi:hypothetical protein
MFPVADIVMEGILVGLQNRTVVLPVHDLYKLSWSTNIMHIILVPQDH